MEVQALDNEKITFYFIFFMNFGLLLYIKFLFANFQMNRKTFGSKPI
jgi:hypothetical protein